MHTTVWQKCGNTTSLQLYEEDNLQREHEYYWMLTTCKAYMFIADDLQGQHTYRQMRMIVRLTWLSPYNDLWSQDSHQRMTMTCKVNMLITKEYGQHTCLWMRMTTCKANILTTKWQWRLAMTIHFPLNKWHCTFLLQANK